MTPEEKPFFIMQQLLASKSYEEIGLKLGVTRSRVEQIVSKHHLKSFILHEYHPNWLTANQAGITLGCSHSLIWKLATDGKIASVRLGRWLFIDPKAHLPCLACGQPRGWKRSYCESCRKEAHRKAAWRSSYRQYYYQRGKRLPLNLIPTHKRSYKKVESEMEE